jgi:hypothetical protein
MMKKTPSKPIPKATTPREPSPLEKALAEADAIIAGLASQLGVKPGPPTTSLNEAAKRMNELEIALREKNATES